MAAAGTQPSRPAPSVRAELGLGLSAHPPPTPQAHLGQAQAAQLALSAELTREWRVCTSRPRGTVWPRPRRWPAARWVLQALPARQQWRAKGM